MEYQLWVTKDCEKLPQKNKVKKEHISKINNKIIDTLIIMVSWYSNHSMHRLNK
jgi:hypothetical protein